MLYSTSIKLQNKEYRVKTGMKAMINLERQGIDIEAIEKGENTSMHDLLKVVFESIVKPDFDFEQFVDLIDESEDITIIEIAEIMRESIKLGLLKGKTDEEIEEKKRQMEKLLKQKA